MADASLYKGFNVLGLENVLPSQGISLNEEDETNQLSDLMQLLFTLLNGMYEKSSGTSMEPIAQLLLRLDFKHYFTQGLQNKMKSTCTV